MILKVAWTFFYDNFDNHRKEIIAYILKKEIQILKEIN